YPVTPLAAKRRIPLPGASPAGSTRRCQFWTYTGSTRTNRTLAARNGFCRPEQLPATPVHYGRTAFFTCQPVTWGGRGSIGPGGDCGKSWYRTSARPVGFAVGSPGFSHRNVMVICSGASLPATVTNASGSGVAVLPYLKWSKSKIWLGELPVAPSGSTCTQFSAQSTDE